MQCASTKQNYFKSSIYTVNAFCSHLNMAVMSFAFPLKNFLLCTRFCQVVLPETYQEGLALVARSGGVDRAAIARELHLPPDFNLGPDFPAHKPLYARFLYMAP